MNSNRLCKPGEHEVSRRHWLGATATGAAALSGLSVGGLGGLVSEAGAAELASKDKQVLFIWIDGGMSQFESWDPKPGTQFGGPFRSIQTAVPGVQISELMPRSAQVTQHLAVVRNLCTQDNSHSAGVPRIQRGDPKDRGVVYPYFGSAVSKLMGSGKSGLPPYVSAAAASSIRTPDSSDLSSGLWRLETASLPTTCCVTSRSARPTISPATRCGPV